jgi:tRNA modification GTPase
MVRARAAVAAADLTVVVLDGTRVPGRDELAVVEAIDPARRVVVFNKCDLGPPSAETEPGAVSISAMDGSGVDALRAAIVARLRGEETSGEVPAVSNARHIALLGEASEALTRARSACAARTPEEFVLTELGVASAALQQITGVRAPDALLAEIFSRFCIGK